MLEETLDLTTRAGNMETFMCRPERGVHPLVLFLMDAAGVRDELYDMARRLASVGYCVLLPNLYYRTGADTKFPAEALVYGSSENARMRDARKQMTIPAVMDDVADMIAWADDKGVASTGPIGVHGYCMSGPSALAAAARYPDRVAAAASFFGTRLISDADESPYQNLGKVKGELHIASAEFDDLSPLRMVAELRQHFEDAGSPGEIEIYPGVHHGFAFPQRKVFDRAAGERHWERLFTLYRRRLGA